MKITAVIPVYNIQPDVLRRVLADLRDYVSETIVVDDGSEINFFEVEEAAGKETFFLRHSVNRGQGAALQTGTDYALARGAEIVVHFDGDGQHRAKDIPTLIAPLKNGRADIVFGSRYLPPANRSKIPLSKKYFIHPLARLVNFFLTGIFLSDAHNGLRALSGAAARKIRLSQDRMAHASEYLQLAKKEKLRYEEAAVEIFYAGYGQGFSGGVRIVGELALKKIIG